MPFGRVVIIAEDDFDGFVFTKGNRLILNAGVTLTNPAGGFIDIDTALDATQGVDDRSFTINGTIEAFLIGGAAIGMDIAGGDTVQDVDSSVLDNDDFIF